MKKKMICEKANECPADSYCADKVEHDYEDFCKCGCFGRIPGSFKGAKCIEVGKQNER